MAVFTSQERALQVATPRQMPNAAYVGGRVRRYRNVINLATVNGGSAVTTADTIALTEIPAGSVFDYGMLTSSVTLGTSTLAIGVAGTTGKYRAAAVSTAVDTPAIFGGATAQADTDPSLAVIYPIVTVAVANLPTTGTVVIDLYFGAN